MAYVTTLPTEYYFFGVTLAGIAVLHRYALTIALAGLGALLTLIFIRHGFVFGSQHLLAHFRHEWTVLTNLLLLPLGFSVLASQFEHSNAPDVVPALLPGGWLGGFSLLVLVAGLSVFLDNIAGAMIGGLGSARSRRWPGVGPEALEERGKRVGSMFKKDKPRWASPRSGAESAQA